MVDVQKLRQVVAQQLSQAATAANQHLAQHSRLTEMAGRAQADAHSSAGAVQALQKVIEVIGTLDKPEEPQAVAPAVE